MRGLQDLGSHESTAVWHDDANDENDPMRYQLIWYSYIYNMVQSDARVYKFLPKDDEVQTTPTDGIYRGQTTPRPTGSV